MPRFFTKDSAGNPVLLLAIDPKTGEVTYRADEEVISKQREKNTNRIAQAVSELAVRDPTSQVLIVGEVVQR